jgi:hypothetical protein
MFVNPILEMKLSTWLTFFLAFTCVAIAFRTHAQGNRLPEIAVVASSEDAEGVTQKDFDLPVLRMLESQTLEQLKSKMRRYLESQGQLAAIPALKSEAHYVEIGKQKLAVIRIRGGSSVNTIFVIGIRGTELRRVACTRTAKIEESIPIFHGLCGEKVKETFGVSPA